VSYEIAMVSGSGFCRLRKPIEMVAMPHLGVSGPVTSNTRTYHRKVDIFEGTADECRAMRDVLGAPNSVMGGSARPQQGIDGSAQVPNAKADLAPASGAQVQRLVGQEGQ
jgi:hypothetical protein